MSANQPSTGQEILDLVNTILNGQDMDSDMFLQLANVAITKIEEERPWQFLKKMDGSQSVAAGNNYSSAKILPTDFRYDYKLMLGTNVELIPIPFEQQHAYRNTYGYYWIDFASGNYYLTGTQGKAESLYQFYIKTTDELTLANQPAMPLRFRAIIAYMVVGYFQNGLDADDIYARMSPENKLAALELKNSMVTWDANLQGRSQNNQQGFSNSAPDLPLGMM